MTTRAPLAPASYACRRHESRCARRSDAIHLATSMALGDDLEAIVT